MEEQMTHPPSVSIVIVNWNGIHHLKTCILSLLEQTYTPKEIIIVDNHSTDGSVDMIKSNFPSIQVIMNIDNLGFATGNNIGIVQATGDLIALINNDTRADRNWLSESINALLHHPDAGFTASRLCLFSEPGILDSAGDEYYSSGYPAKRGSLEEFGPPFDVPEYVFGSCAGAALYRKDMLNHVGLFDETYFNYQEDVDLSFRCQLQGYRCIYVPTAIVYHKVSATAGRSSPKKQFWSHRNHWFTLIKDMPTRLLIKYLPDIIIAELAVGISCILQKRWSIFWAARIEVIQKIPAILKQRKVIQNKRTVSIQYLESIVKKNWIIVRKREKYLEEKYSAIT